MKIHQLKIQHKYLVDIALGLKRFELRKNDRDYSIGDLIQFKDLKDTAHPLDAQVYIDKEALYFITYVLKDVPQYGLDADYCILGIEKLKEV